MLFEASTTYAPGEPHGDVGYSQYQNMNPLARFDLSNLKGANVWVGLGALALGVFLVHKYGGRRR